MDMVTVKRTFLRREVPDLGGKLKAFRESNGMEFLEKYGITRLRNSPYVKKGGISARELARRVLQIWKQEGQLLPDGNEASFIVNVAQSIIDIERGASGSDKYQWFLLEAIGENTEGTSNVMHSPIDNPIGDAPQLDMREVIQTAPTLGGVGGTNCMVRRIRENVLAPSDSKNDPNAFGLIMSGTHMEPRLMTGNVLWVFPSYQIETGDDVLISPRNPEVNDFRYILRYVRDAGTHWHAEQLKPALDHVLSKLEWPHCHVIGYVERRRRTR